jgi:hypothetical protein
MLPVIHVLGSMLMMFSVTYVLPIATALVYADGHSSISSWPRLRASRPGHCSGRQRGARSANCAHGTALSS